MASRSGARSLMRCRRLGEGVVNEVKPSFQPSRAFSSKPIGCESSTPPATTRSIVPQAKLSVQAALKPEIRRSFASQTETDIKKTPLYDLHVAKKAKFVPFGGYSMPLYYDDLTHVESHHWTREKASIFDVSHMYGFVILSHFTH